VGSQRFRKGWLKFFTLFLVYTWIWLNLPRDDRHFFYIFVISLLFSFSFSWQNFAIFRQRNWIKFVIKKKLQ
jgi:hypothetical protein